MAKFRKRPVEVEAVKILAADFNGESWDGSPFSETPNWLLDAISNKVVKPVPCDRDYTLWDIRTLEGVVRAEPDHYIVRGLKGELYPVRDDIFAATYEPIT